MIEPLADLTTNHFTVLADLTTNHLTVTGDTQRENFMKCQRLLQAALAVLPQLINIFCLLKCVDYLLQGKMPEGWWWCLIQMDFPEQTSCRYLIGSGNYT